jgi:hypothetical protein
MRFHSSDWKWASIAAVTMVSLAAGFVLTVLPGGFETQAAWFLLLFPGAFLAYPLSDSVFRLVPRAEPVVFSASMVGFNFLWYWTVSYVVIKIRRAVTAA